MKVGIFTPRHNVDKLSFLHNPHPDVEYKILAMDHVLPNPKRSKFIDWQYLETEDLFNFFIFRLINFRNTDSIDVLHTCNSVSVNNKPWVCSFEYFPCLLMGDLGPLNFVKKTIIDKYINSDNCKFLLPWSEWAKKSAEKLITNPEIFRKLRVVYPGVKIKENVNLNKDTSKIKFLFVGNEFERKGGMELLNAFNAINREYPNTILTIIGKVKEEILRNNQNPNIIFKGILENQKTLEEYQKHHIFVLPTKMDSFGYAILEAMSYGLPIITCNHSALPEMVENEKNGFLLDVEFRERLPTSLEEDTKICEFNLNDKEINNSIENELKKKMEIFISNPNLITQMGNSSLEIIKNKFSFEKRNKIITKIYTEAIEE